MSDRSLSIVPRQSTVKDGQWKAVAILEWLVSRDIVKAALSDCVLGARGGYPISRGAVLVSSWPDLLPFDLAINGLEIRTGRQVFDTGGSGLQNIFCPRCGGYVVSQLDDLLTQWLHADVEDLACPHCKTCADIHRFSFIPRWGFSDLGFSFWN